MKILFISDLHLCDKRNSIAFEKRRMSKLAEFIGSCGCDLVVNLGDAVSRREFLRLEFSCEADGFDYYLAWRNTLSVPFIECAIDREFDFFEKLCEEKKLYKMGGSDHSGILGGPGCDDPNSPYEQSGVLEEDFMKIYERRLG